MTILDKVASGGYFGCMRTVGLKTLKNKLSEYVRLAASGETVVITDRNRVVAEIVPPWRDSNKFFERGVREGWLTPPTDRCRSWSAIGKTVDLSRVRRRLRWPPALPRQKCSPRLSCCLI